jgi:hypothetical protein
MYSVIACFNGPTQWELLELATTTTQHVLELATNSYSGVAVLATLESEGHQLKNNEGANATDLQFVCKYRRGSKLKAGNKQLFKLKLLMSNLFGTLGPCASEQTRTMLVRQTHPSLSPTFFTSRRSPSSPVSPSLLPWSTSHKWLRVWHRLHRLLVRLPVRCLARCGRERCCSAPAGYCPCR